MKRVISIILTLMAILAGNVSCNKNDVTPESSMLLVSMSIIPDFSDGSVYSYSDDGSFFLRVSVTPKKYIDDLLNDKGFVCKAEFRSVITKAVPEDPDFTVVGEITFGSVEEGYMTASFSLSETDMAKVLESDYVVSFSMEDKDGVRGASTTFVPVSCYTRGGGGGDAIVVNGHMAVKLAGTYWATENMGECNDVTAVAGPDCLLNDWGFYYYNQSNALVAAESWGYEVNYDEEQAYTWTLPTEIQWQALLDNCDWVWTTYDGKPGYRVSDKSDSSIFIFLPAAGHFPLGFDAVFDQGSKGCYWSADDGNLLEFSDYDLEISSYESGEGFSVRPVANVD